MCLLDLLSQPKCRNNMIEIFFAVILSELHPAALACAVRQSVKRPRRDCVHERHPTNATK